EVGNMSEMSRVSALLESAVERGTVSGAVGLVRQDGKVVFHEAFGLAETGPNPRPATPTTLFDLASLTKPLVGAGVTLALVDRGVMSLDEEVTGALPELRSLRGQGVTYRRLVSHTAGIPGWRPLYVKARGKSEILAAVDDLGLASAPGSRFEYSDIGFMTLGIALERLGGQSLPELAEALIFEPCGLSRTTYLPSFPKEEYAVTEEGNAFERRMAEWAGLEFDRWRTTFHPGEVNDGNAHYGLGGVSAHAGLFSDAHEVGVLGEMWLRRGDSNGRRVLSSAVVDLAITNQMPGRNAARGLGWDLAKRHGPTSEELSRADAGFFPPTDSAWSPRASGELLSASAFGHTGFTGTSVWMDPARDLVMVLLTNATHPRVDLDKPVNGLRARFHNVVAAATDAPVLR
ncbi:MAG: serine hydrolase domain-containing protein, partial [Acidimicrobiia bacterium]